MPRILLVDDDNQFRNMCRLTLERMGYAVTEACNGAEAWRLFHSDGADLIIMDLIMPDREGLETIRQFRANNVGVKILAVSGGGRVDARDMLKAATLFGANSALPKPFTQAELSAQLISLLGPIPKPLKSSPDA